MADGREWGEWLGRHGAALLLLARQWVPTHADAEDVVQEAFVRFWKARHQTRDRLAYLYAAVRNGARDWRRGSARRGRREAAAARPEPAFAPSPELDERRAAVELALRELPEDQREVLVLKIWGGLTFAEIAAALTIPANTAASRYRYGLEKLRQVLAEEPTP